MIRVSAREAGFSRVGVAPADGVAGADAFDAWIAAGYHGEMGYLARNRAKRFQADKLVPGARSVICVALSYAPDPRDRGAPDRPRDEARAAVSRYARGRDYHKVLKNRCRRLIDAIRRIVPNFEGRAFVDSAPVSERGLSAAAGIGWIGRNGCLIVPGLGSCVVLGEIVCNLALPPGSPVAGGCGDCDACIRACPTGACLGDSLVDARRCLSYLTIEHSGPVADELRPAWGNRVFGCDACQDSCPHNRDVPAGDPELLDAPPGAGKEGRKIHDAPLGELLGWDENQWDLATRGSAMRRAGFERFLRNVILAAGASGGSSLAAPLRRLRRSSPELAELTGWALDRVR